MELLILYQLDMTNGHTISSLLIKPSVLLHHKTTLQGDHELMETQLTTKSKDWGKDFGNPV